MPRDLIVVMFYEVLHVVAYSFLYFFLGGGLKKEFLCAASEPVRELDL